MTIVTLHMVVAEAEVAHAEVAAVAETAAAVKAVAAAVTAARFRFGGRGSEGRNSKDTGSCEGERTYFFI